MNLLLNPILAASTAADKGLIKPLGKEQLLLVLIELGLLLLVARALGELMRRINFKSISTLAITGTAEILMAVAINRLKTKR